MADLKSVGVRLYALNADYKKSMKESGDATQSFGKVSGVALAAVGTAAAAFALKAADSYVAYGKTIMGLARVSGETVETMSKMNFAAQQTGVSSETLANGIKFLQKNMASGNAEFEKLNVTTKNADGSYRNVHDVFLDTADAISKMSNATEKADAIRQIFGRNGQALGAMLNKGRDGIIALEADAQKYGLVLTQNNIPAIQANIKAHREMDAAMQGAQNQIGQQVLPTLTKAITLFSNLPGPIASSIAPLAGVTGGVILLTKATAALGLSMGPLGAVIAAAGAGYILWNQRLEQGAKGVESMSAAVNKTTSGAQSMDDLNRIMGKTSDEMRAMKQAADDVHAPWDVFYKKDLRDGTNSLMATTIAQAALKAEVEQYAKVNGVSTDVALKNVQAEKAKAKAVAETGSATGITADEVKALTEANKAENDSLRASIDPLFAMNDAMTKLGDAKQKDAETGMAVVAAQNALNQAILIYGPNSAPALDAQWKLNEATAAHAAAQNDQVRAALDVEVATNNLETAFKTNTISLDQSKATLQGWVAQGLITQGQADSVGYRFWLLKSKADELNGHSIVMGVDVNTSTFFAKMNEVWAALNPQTAHINPNWGAGGLGGIGSAIGNVKGARASGGPVSAGNTYLVGEHGPELFEAGMSGNIVANGAKGTRGNPYEDGSFRGMTAADKAAQNFVESIQRQQAMRDHPELQGKPGWGSLAVDPFAGWDRKADFSRWGTTATGGGGQGGQAIDQSISVTVNAPNYVGDKRELVDAVREVIRRDEGGRKRA